GPAIARALVFAAELRPALVEIRDLGQRAPGPVATPGCAGGAEREFIEAMVAGVLGHALEREGLEQHRAARGGLAPGLAEQRERSRDRPANHGELGLEEHRR